MRLMAVKTFDHPTRGRVLREEVFEEDDEALVGELVRKKEALYTNRKVRHMVKVKALKTTTEPSTEATIFKDQVLAVSDEDAKVLIAAGDARKANDDEKLTRDVGKLREAQGDRPEGEE
jgi:hypothetical protein